jgi:uncharacterized protein
VFSSAAREDDFDPDRSDVDFLVEFAADEQPLSLAQFFGNYSHSLVSSAER